MTEILDNDYITPEKPRGGTFAKLSFGSAMLTLCLAGYLMVLIPDSISPGDERLNAIWMTTLGIEISVLVGIIFSVISLIKKEKLRVLKAIGVSLNLLYFLALLGAIALAMFLERGIME